MSDLDPDSRWTLLSIRNHMPMVSVGAIAIVNGGDGLPWEISERERWAVEAVARVVPELVAFALRQISFTGAPWALPCDDREEWSE